MPKRTEGAREPTLRKWLCAYVTRRWWASWAALVSECPTREVFQWSWKKVLGGIREVRWGWHEGGVVGRGGRKWGVWVGVGVDGLGDGDEVGGVGDVNEAVVEVLVGAFGGVELAVVDPDVGALLETGLGELGGIPEEG